MTWSTVLEVNKTFSNCKRMGVKILGYKNSKSNKFYFYDKQEQKILIYYLIMLIFFKNSLVVF